MFPIVDLAVINMILAIKSHLSYFLEKGIISNVNSREINNSEGVGLDLAIAEIYEIQNEEAILGKEIRKTPSSQLVTPNIDGYLHLKPGKSYLVKTSEIFNLIPSISCQFYPRSTLFRSGIIFQSSILSVGYFGPMIFNLTNIGKQDFLVELGARFATAVFTEVKGDSNSYRGQWNEGRVSQPNIEKQI